MKRIVNKRKSEKEKRIVKEREKVTERERESERNRESKTIVFERKGHNLFYVIK